jgi:AcrR family transcriptional regulator
VTEPAHNEVTEPAHDESAGRKPTGQNRDRVARRRVDKFEERRAELAEAARQTLAEQGYARTSLRDIAQNSAFSHGVLHYYFADKFDLITYCVGHYKAECAKRYDSILATASTPEELLTGITFAMAATLRADAAMHRLWYDLRNQSQFEEAFRADAQAIDQSIEQMIWSIASRLAELSGATLGVTPSVAYALADGLFQHALLRYLSGDETTTGWFIENMRLLLASLLRPVALS